MFRGRVRVPYSLFAVPREKRESLFAVSLWSSQSQTEYSISVRGKYMHTSWTLSSSSSVYSQGVAVAYQKLETFTARFRQQYCTALSSYYYHGPRDRKWPGLARRTSRSKQPTPGRVPSASAIKKKALPFPEAKNGRRERGGHDNDASRRLNPWLWVEK